uniref:WAP four-disulfide core domain 2 n=1 Tax=Sinocyclocheilus anshuiensis TaxID=1608454 RepID=A0A671NVJ1_9TELE
MHKGYNTARQCWSIVPATQNMHHIIGLCQLCMTLRFVVEGYCPGKLTVMPSRRGCSSDRNLNGNVPHSVMFSVCITAKPGECPPQSSGRLCTRSCRSDSNCPNNKKCCSNGCGRYCNAPYPVKPGQCPDPKNIPLCAESCFHDGQCPATQKCCPTTRGAKWSGKR